MESTAINSSSNALPTVVEVVNAKYVKSASEAQDAIIVSNEGTVPSAPSLESEIVELKITNELDVIKLSSGDAKKSFGDVTKDVDSELDSPADVVQSGDRAIHEFKADKEFSGDAEIAALKLDDVVDLKAPLSADIADMPSGDVGTSGSELESSEDKDEKTALEDGAIQPVAADADEDAEDK